jgi:hypothetical protein
MAWTKPGPGRPKGLRNASTVIRIAEAREFAELVVSDPQYRQNLLERARKGLLHPSVELVLYYYAFGKPVESLSIEDTTPIDLSQLSPEQLHARALRIASSIAFMQERQAEERGERDEPTTLVVQPKEVM